MNKAYYEGVRVPEERIRFDEQHDADRFALVSVEKESTCNRCDGTGLCVCDECGHEHDCGSCAGSGRKLTKITAWVENDFLADLQAQQHTQQLLRQRYGKEVDSVADWWLA